MYNHIITSVIGHSKVISFAGHLTYIIYLIPFWILTWTNVLTDQFLQLDILILRKWLGPAHRTEHIFFSLYGYFTSIQLNFFFQQPTFFFNHITRNEIIGQMRYPLPLLTLRQQVWESGSLVGKPLDSRVETSCGCQRPLTDLLKRPHKVYYQLFLGGSSMTDLVILCNVW